MKLWLTGFFGSVTLEAASAWDELVDTAVLVFLRHVIGGLVTDEEMMEGLKAIPEWIAT